MGVSENRGVFPPNHPLKNRVFQYFHHPFLGETPLFLEIPKYRNLYQSNLIKNIGNRDKNDQIAAKLIYFQYNPGTFNVVLSSRSIPPM